MVEKSMAFLAARGRKHGAKKGLQGPGSLLHIPMPCRADADFRIVPLTEAELDDVLAIENGAFPRPWTRQHFLDELASPLAAARIALTGDGEVAGYICCRTIIDEAEILDVAVAPAWRRCGVGALLVRWALADCRHRGVITVGLEVRVSNRAAIALYHDLGFHEAGRRRGYYENGEDALLMQCALSSTNEGQ
jgi:ribosomal-protein-alanine N-acetyltransferase